MSSSTVKEQILVVEATSTTASDRIQHIAKYVDDADVQSVHSIEELRTHLGQHYCDVIVLDYSLVAPSYEMLLQELKLQDHAPEIIMLAKGFSPEEIRKLYNAGCSRCVVESDQRDGELGLTVRHMARMKRLEEENRKLIAKLTEANALLSEKNKRLDEFSGTVAHDIRGPLGGICMRLEYMRDVYKDDLDSRFRDLLEGSLSASRRLIDVVQAMYDFAKLGTHAKKVEAIELTSFVEEVIQDLVFDDRLDIQIGIDELPTVWANPGLLRKVFINLFNNAVKYNDKRKIFINVGVCGMKERSLGNFVEIYVQDNGPGIPEANQEAVFGMFDRGDPPDDVEGMGIGLAVVKRVIELHYGSLALESSPEHGSKFMFSLPLEQIDFVA